MLPLSESTMLSPDILRNLSTLSHFDDAGLERLAALGSLELCTKGSPILAAADPPTRLLLLVNGALRTRRSTPVGELTLGHVLPGDLAGEVALIDGLPYGADTIAETDGRFVAFDGAVLRSRISNDPAFAMPVLWSLWKTLSDKLRRIDNRLADFFGTEGRKTTIREVSAKNVEQSVQIDLGAKAAVFFEQKLSPLEIKMLSSLSYERYYAPGEIIFNEGDIGEEMFVVLSGCVMIQKHIPGAGEEALGFLERGAYFGEMALLDRQPRIAGARAHDEGATVLTIPQSVVDGLLDIDSISSIRLLEVLTTLLAQRVRESSEKLLGWFVLSGGQKP